MWLCCCDGSDGVVIDRVVNCIADGRVGDVDVGDVVLC